MTDRDAKMVDYMVVVVSEFASEVGISNGDAFDALLRSGGIDALEENYDIEHTLPLSSTVQALEALCARQGVALA